MIKRNFFLLLALAVCVFTKAQYDEAYAKLNTMLNPDNSLAKPLKKTKFTQVTITGYEPDAEDTAETVFTELTRKYDEQGRLIHINVYPGDGSVPYSAYTYDEKGKVVKYTEMTGALSVFEFEYLPKDKGIKTIKYSGPKNYQWDEAKGLLMAVTEIDTQYFYIKEGKLHKHVQILREKNYAKGFYYADSTHYTYDKKGNLASFKSVTTDPWGDTTGVVTGTFTFDKNGRLTKSVIKDYDFSFERAIPKTETEHSYAYSKKEGTLGSHTYYHKNNYMYGGELMSDNFSVDEVYTYGANGLPVKVSRSADPGVVVMLQYEYK